MVNILRKAVIYFFLLQFVSGGMLEKEMSKWDGYWRHFQYHKSRNSDYTFARFVYVHFLDGKHDKWRKKRHRSLPYKKRSFTTSQIAHIIGNVNKEKKDKIYFNGNSAEKKSAPKSLILSDTFTSLFRPPCA